MFQCKDFCYYLPLFIQLQEMGGLVRDVGWFFGLASKTVFGSMI
eukprot:UN00128